MRRDKLIPIDGEIRARTEKAILFYDGSTETWFPLSQVELADDETGILCPEWLAEEKGLI